MKLKLCYLLIFVVSCNLDFSNKDFEFEIYHKILPLLINKYGEPIVVPPPPKSFIENPDDVKYSTNKSLKKLGVYPLFTNYKLKKIDFDFKDFEYQKLIDKHNLSKREKIMFNEIKNPSIKYDLNIVDTTFSKRKQYLTYYKQLFFSKPAVNNKKNKALVTVAIKGSGMILCILKKQDNKWHIKSTKQLLVY